MEARRVAGGEHLLGVSEVPAGTAHLLRYCEVKVEDVVVAGDVPGAAVTVGGGLRRVDPLRSALLIYPAPVDTGPVSTADGGQPMTVFGRGGA